MKWLKVEHSVAAPGAALVKVVGVLVEVPVMLSVCAACNRHPALVPGSGRGLVTMKKHVC